MVAAVALAIVVGGVVAGNAQPAPPALAPLTAEQLLSKLIAASEATTSSPTYSGEASSSVNLGLPQLPAGLGVPSSNGLADLVMGDQSTKCGARPMACGSRTCCVPANAIWSPTQPTPGSGTRRHRPRSTWRTTRRRSQQRADAEEADGHAAGPRDAGDQDRAPVGAVRRAERDFQPMSRGRADLHARAHTNLDEHVGRQDRGGARREQLDAAAGRGVRQGGRPPAISAGFTSISFGPVDPSMFDFTPPAGATVTTAALPTGEPQRGEQQ